MKTVNIAALIGTLVMMTGCVTTEKKIRFGVDGYNHGSKKDVVRVVFKGPVGERIAPEHLSQLKVYPETALISNKRMVILTGRKGTFTKFGSHDVEIRPAVGYSAQDGERVGAYGCFVKLDMRIADNETGAYVDGGSGIELEGASAVKYTKNRFNHHGVNIDYNDLFRRAYKIALDKLVRRVNEIYPINGTVLSIKNKGELTEFRLDRGTNYGITSGSEFHVYYLDDEENMTWVGIAYGHVGKTSSQVTVAHWNTADPEVAGELMPRIRRNDRKLRGRLFFVCRTAGDK